MSVLKRVFGKKKFHLEDFPPIKKHMNKGKPVFAYFYSQSCAVCEKTDPIVEELEPQFPAINFLKFDVENYPRPELKKHGLAFLPTLALYGKDGKTLHYSVGSIEKPKLEELFKMAIEH